jgi:Anti-sigma-K factor rskA
MIRDHAAIEELLAVRALDGLDGDDNDALERELEAHGPDCEDCRALEREFSETAGMLAMALDPEPLDPTMPDRIVASAQAEPTPAQPEPDEIAARRDRRPATRIVASIVGVAASIALIVAGLAILQPNALRVSGVATSQRFVVFDGKQGELAMAYVPGEAGMVVVGSRIPEPPAEHAYELWTFDGDTPVSAGCMSPESGHMGAFIPDVEPTETMAVTIEPTTCPQAPTGDIVFTGSIA